MGGTATFMAQVDQKGRIHIPLALREEIGIKEQVILQQYNNELRLRPLKAMNDPVAFLSSIQVKTRKTPVQMKREAEEGFLR